MLNTLLNSLKAGAVSYTKPQNDTFLMSISWLKINTTIFFTYRYDEKQDRL